ncbi:Ancient ubiquitous protein 1 [Blattella germanica]|nr:Ancient ubiquitous protein 1 [Blattella germanica]
MSNVEVKNLFDENRYPSGWKALFFILYTPIGLILVFIRILIALQALLVAFLLPQLPAVKSFILRCICVVLGVIVKQENTTAKDDNLKVLVANHITPCDHIPVHLISGSITHSVLDLPAPLSWALGIKDLGLRQGRADIRNHFEKSTTPVLCFPEGATTNGKVGLLKYLPSIVKEEGENDAQIGERVAKIMAVDLGIVATQHTAADKAEYEKRYLLEQNQPIIVRATGTSELHRMARQVGEVLPYVPHDVIIRDLVRTRSVDVTISNILEGVVRYTPQVETVLQPPPTPAREVNNIPSTSTSSPSSTQPAPSTQSSCLDTSAPSFPRSAQERMLSFNERKARLIENARQRYIEKHGLKNVGLNC